MTDVHAKELWSGLVNGSSQSARHSLCSERQAKGEGLAFRGSHQLPATIHRRYCECIDSRRSRERQHQRISREINSGYSARVSWQSAETVQSVITAMTYFETGGFTEDSSVQPKKATTYQLQASGPGGKVTQTANVDVNTTVQSSIEASPAEVRYRRIGDKVLEQGSANVGWKATNANSITIDQFGAVAADSTRTITVTPRQDANGPVNEVQTYTLVATNECGGSSTHTASVRVTGSIEPIPDVPLASVFFPTGYPDASHPRVGLVKSQQEALDRMAAGFKKYLDTTRMRD